MTCVYNPLPTAPGTPPSDFGPAGSSITRKDTTTYVVDANINFMYSATNRTQTFTQARTPTVPSSTYSATPIDINAPTYITHAFYLSPESNGPDSAAPAPGRRRLLMQKKTGKQHFQGTTTIVAGGNFIWVSCFTGFGEASLININSIVDNQPTMDNCITRINAERPNFTVEKLRVAVNTFQAQNPGAI